MNQQVPLEAVPSQNLSVALGGQQANISVYQRGDNLYFDLTSNGSPIVTTRICRNKQLLLIDALYRGFRGDFMFLDTQGDEQPNYTGLGTRYLLLYLES